MKKKLAAILASAMVLTLGMSTVFAAGSAEVDQDEFASATGSEDTVIGAVSDTGSVSYDEEADSYTVAVTVSSVADTDLVEGESYWIQIEGAYFYAEYTADGFVISAEDLEAAEVTLEDGTDYEVVIVATESEEESKDTEDTEDTEDLEEGDTDTEDSENSEASVTNPSSDSDDTTAPPTGAAAVLPVLAVAALAGVVVCGKKAKFYE